VPETVCRAVAPYLDHHGGRFDVHAPNVRLTPQQVLAVAMTLQELATHQVWGTVKRH
jgi:two-component sensor histidine kinase